MAGAVPGAHAEAPLREEPARLDAELECVNAAGLAMPLRLVFGRSPERALPQAAGGEGFGAGDRDRAVSGGKPLAGTGPQRFLPWNAAPTDLGAWAQPSPPGG